MKGKILLFVAMAALCCGGMNAINKKTVDQIRIYINPGHGSWGSNDRPMKTVGHPTYNVNDPDTCGFYESNTNLRKGFAFLEALHEAGVPFDRTKNQDNTNPARLGAALDLSQNLVMSHVKIGPYPYKEELKDAYNRKLSEINEEVERNNFDFFISIHSNAATEGSSTNFPLFLYLGQDNEEKCPGSIAVADHIWPYAFGNKHQPWSNYSETSKNIRGDMSFMHDSITTTIDGKQFTGYYGVLRHGVPGFLVEGYFHTYSPSRHRALNFDVCRHEGNLYARGFIDFMGWKAQTYGEVYGIVRDQHEKFNHAYYKPSARTNDVYKPLNGVIVKLLKDGQVIAKDTTDSEYNGVYFFPRLQPGNYSVTFEAEGYKEAAEEYTKAFSVKANETTYLSTFLESKTWVAPEVIYENYTDPLKDVKGYVLADEYNMQQEGTDVNPLEAQLADKTIQRQLVRNGYTYVLAFDANQDPFIYAVKLADNTVTEISTAGLTLEGGRLLKLSDIAFTADNVLCGINYGENQFDGSHVEAGKERGVVKVFKWAKDATTELPTGDPQEWFNSMNSGNYFNAMTGHTLAISGTTDECSIMTIASTIYSSTSMRFIEFFVSGGQLVSTAFINKNISADSNYTLNKLGEDVEMIVSPNADDQFVIDGSKTTPIEIKTAPERVDAPLLGRIAETSLVKEGNGASFFKYAGQSVMVAPSYEEGKLVGVKMFNVTNGFDNATEIATSNTNIAAETVKYATASGRVITELNAEDKVVDAQIELYLLRDGKVSKFTTNGVEQPVVRGNYPYALNATVGETETTFTFKSTGATDEGNIAFLNKDTKEVITKVATGAIVTGENSVTIANAEIPEGEVAWQVEVVGKAIATPTKVKAEPFNYARGIMIDKNPASKHFGTVYISNAKDGEKAKGIWKYDQNLNPINTTAVAHDEFMKGNTASPFRMGMMNDGTVLVADWSDSHAGLYMLNPETDQVTNIFKGTKDGAGAFVVDGQVIAGGTTCASIIGEGENTKLYTFVEDYPKGNAGNKLVRYDIGTSREINKAPNAVFEEASGLLINTNVNVVADENGVWASQTRSSGNNTADVPALIYMDNEGKILYNSGKQNALDLEGCSGSGFAVSNDGKTLAIANGKANVNIYEVTRNGIVPTLNYQYTIPCANGTLDQIVFDNANNIYLSSRSMFQVWSLPTENNVGITPASKTILVNQSSVEENEVVANETRVYPNPAEDVVYVDATEEIDNIAIFNVAGAAVNAEVSINGNSATIQVAGLTSGVYFVKINDSTAVTVLKK